MVWELLWASILKCNQLNRKKRYENDFCFNLSMPMALRSASKLLSASDSILSISVKRGFHSTGVKRMGGHGHNEPYYLHAKHMYNLDRMKHQKLKMSLSVLAAFSIGVAVPVYAVVFQQKKTASG